MTTRRPKQNFASLTDHYRNFPSVLMRLSAADAASVEAMLRRRRRELAPKRIRAQFDATTVVTPKARRKPT